MSDPCYTLYQAYQQTESTHPDWAAFFKKVATDMGCTWATGPQFGIPTGPGETSAPWWAAYPRKEIQTAGPPAGPHPGDPPPDPYFGQLRYVPDPHFGSYVPDPYVV